MACSRVNFTFFFRLRSKCDGTRAETRFRLSAKRTSPFKSAGGRQFSRLLAAEVCASAVVMLDTPCSEVVWRVLATHSIRQFPLHFPTLASLCAITFQLDSTGSLPGVKRPECDVDHHLHLAPRLKKEKNYACTPRYSLYGLFWGCSFTFTLLWNLWTHETALDSSWNVMVHGDAWVGKWRGNWRMEWVASTLHTTSEYGVSSITTIDAHTSDPSSRPNWRPLPI